MEKERLNAWTFLPLKYEILAKPIMNKVVVLMPPAVESGEPPINIKKQEIALPAIDKLSWL